VYFPVQRRDFALEVSWLKENDIQKKNHVNLLRDSATIVDSKQKKKLHFAEVNRTSSQRASENTHTYTQYISKFKIGGFSTYSALQFASPKKKKKGMNDESNPQKK